MSGVISMDREQLVSAVKDTTGLSGEQADQAVHATLKVLGERLAGGETKDLAAQLPPAFADDLPAQGGGERFGVHEFYERVAEHEGGWTPEQARQHARAVAAALKNSVTGHEFDEIASQLPGEFDDLLGTGPVQH